MATRSPVPHRPLPQAGESLREAALDLFFDRFFVWALMAMPIAVVAIVELIGQWLRIPITPWYWVAVALILGTLATSRWFRIRPQLAALRQGIRGERMIGRMLEDVRSLGYVAFHDIPGDGFNVDHALVGPGGVFAIETKTWSLPEGRRAEIDYDGKSVLVAGNTPDRDPVAQAKAVADHLRNLLKRMTDREVTVRPVVLFPGWWVNQKTRNPWVWVLNPKALRSFLANESEKLSREDIALFVDRLTVHLSSE
jgi:Nuclease-related domain